MTTREKLLNRKFKQEKLAIDLGEGPQEIFVRKPSVNDRAAIFAAAGASAGNAEVKDLAKLQVVAVIACTYDSEGHKVFTDADERALRELPADDAFDALANCAVAMLGATSEEAAKK